MLSKIKNPFYFLKVKKLTFEEIFIIFSYMSIILYYASDSIFGQVFLLFNLGLLLIFNLRRGVKPATLIFISISILSFSLLSIFARSYPYNYSIAILFYGVFSLLLANSIFQSKHKIRLTIIFYMLFLIFLWANFLHLGFKDPDLYNDIFTNNSRNVVSAFLILITILVGITFHIKQLKQPLTIYFITLLSSIILFGRSGIAASFVLFCYGLFNNYGKRSYWLIILLPIIIFLVIQYYSQIEFFLSEETSFKYGIESPRSYMLDQYLHRISSSSRDVLFGRDYKECCSIIASYGFNPHNSFIVGHARYGIFHAIFFTLITSTAFFYVVYSKKSIIFIFFILLIYSRYSLDQLGLFSPIDFVLFYIFILIFKQKNATYHISTYS